MIGFITKKEVITNATMIIGAFGLRVFLSCIVAKNGTTFLTILTKNGRI